MNDAWGDYCRYRSNVQGFGSPQPRTAHNQPTTPLGPTPSNSPFGRSDGNSSTEINRDYARSMYSDPYSALDATPAGMYQTWPTNLQKSVHDNVTDRHIATVSPSTRSEAMKTSPIDLATRTPFLIESEVSDSESDLPYRSIQSTEHGTLAHNDRYSNQFPSSSDEPMSTSKHLWHHDELDVPEPGQYMDIPSTISAYSSHEMLVHREYVPSHIPQNSANRYLAGHHDHQHSSPVSYTADMYPICDTKLCKSSQVHGWDYNVPPRQSTTFGNHAHERCCPPSPSKVSTSKLTSSPSKMIEIAPGVHVPLRGAEEVRWVVELPVGWICTRVV
jgi:hypothetical protein